MKAVVIDEFGGPEVLQYRDHEDPEPGPGQVILDLEAIGVNFIDIYHRTGLYPGSLPLVPGSEGAGTVSAVGEGVDWPNVGDRVAFAMQVGSYAERMAVDASMLVAVPDGVGLDVAAASMLQGMTAHYLAISTYPLEEGSVCVVHAGAGGVGLLLTQVAKMRGATVFATVGSEEKAELSRGAGADHVILYREQDFGDAVQAAVGPNAVDVVYDGVGKATFERGMDLLRPRGVMVSFGNASGPPDPVSPLALAQKGSIFLTRPSLGHYLLDREELDWRAGDLFDWIASGVLDVRIGARFPLSEAAEAQEALAGRRTTGKVLLIP